MGMKKASQSLLLSTGAGVKVAVLDSGVNPHFPTLRGKVGKIFDCQDGDAGLQIRQLPAGENADRNGHGSFVQSCIQVVAPDAEVDHFRILDENNNCDSSLLCYVLDHVAGQGYQVINLSLGTRNEEHIPWLVSIMKRAYERNICVVAACSNIGNSLYPARFTYCVSVEAMAAQHPLQLRFKPNSVVEFAGWGINVPLAALGDRQAFLSGSSYAAGHVSGLCARVIEMQRAASPLDTKIMLREYALTLESDMGPSSRSA